MNLKVISWSGLTFFAVTLTLVAYWYLRPSPLVASAREMITAMRDGNGDVLYEYALSDERKCSDLSPEKIHRLWEILIQPAITHSKFVGAVPAALESNQTQSTAAFRFLTRQGDPWKLDVIANQSDEGVKAGIVYSMLATASLFDEDGHVNPTLTPNLALAGVRRYRPKLESIGIRSLMLGPGTCVTWDQLEQKLQPRS